ncbi:MAG: hypothetical protein IAE82_04160 [Opitutaceae bacterium]|nr:hypothetical protein [Opitutaceae bacterium]
MSIRFPGFIVALGLAILAGCLPAAPAATTGDLDRDLAREPAVVVSHAGRNVRGLLDGFRDGRLHLRLATDGGEVGYSFAPGEIASLEFPGVALEAEILEHIEHGNIAAAMPMLEALARHRIRYLPVLDASRRHALWILAEHADATVDPHTVRAVVRALAPLADTPERKLALAGAELELALRTSTSDEVRTAAERWCALADPCGASALGWRVLAEQAYASGDNDRARWLALQPTTFAGRLGMRDLDRCYAVAIRAAERTGDRNHAATLRREMLDRGLAWPDSATAEPDPGRTSAHAPSSDLPAAVDLDHIRKTTSVSETR